MSKTTLAECKSSLNIDFTDDDVKLQRLLDAAELHLCKYTQRSIKELCERSYSGMDLPADLKIAIIALVGSWYRTPEATTTFSINNVDLNFERIVEPYMRLV